MRFLIRRFYSQSTVSNSIKSVVGLGLDVNDKASDTKVQKLEKASLAMEQNIDNEMSAALEEKDAEIWGDFDFKKCLKNFEETSIKESKVNVQKYMDQRELFFESLHDQVQDLPKSDPDRLELVRSKQFDEENLSSEAITVQQLMAASAHIGHMSSHTSHYNYHAGKFCLGSREGIMIIDLDKTLFALRRCINVVRETASKRGLILWIGTRALVSRLTYECARNSGQYYIDDTYVQGTITNRLKILNCDVVPDLIILLSPGKDKYALEEAYKSSIPTISICDTDTHPIKITYPIPANDDALASVSLIAKSLMYAAIEGREIANNSGKYSFSPAKSPFR
ncbi:ribosomal protein S2 [Rozella allomycis CSF55]|uniref:Ribosomal protein S2 n=1 Tax=Rozella allomycis (strain CSF55) TaxID=988480 RepID=A0A075ATI0_ROZAC|nr:Ribosomal protein S2, flavodoxin-like domain-containing protein [Rozella allomycis CSF55]RKP19708.1 ribosomal protein S2 [Rozella allomycis CSF55]|eukprot:EPZ32030.1 Ribosomal protein S2, flavodoxin-like domain-containing protein [Rozella allomycis CSF55]